MRCHLDTFNNIRCLSCSKRHFPHYTCMTLSWMCHLPVSTSAVGCKWPSWSTGTQTGFSVTQRLQSQGVEYRDSSARTLSAIMVQLAITGSTISYLGLLCVCPLPPPPVCYNEDHPHVLPIFYSLSLPNLLNREEIYICKLKYVCL